jgi:methyltransferase (TIGR00027 family)
MREHVASRTALAASLMRARHARLDPMPLIDDRWGDRLVPDSVRRAVREMAIAVADGGAAGAGAGAGAAAGEASPDPIVDDFLRGNPAYANVILRSRYTEDALEIAVANGVRQYVVIGAGFDSFSLRRPAFAQDVDVFEIDHPATQDLKLERLEKCGVTPSASTHFVAADLGVEDLRAALSRSPFRPDQPAFFSWLGVTMYLTREANMTALRAIVACSAPGSELVFTYLDERALRSRRGSDGFRGLQRAVAALNEPFVSGFDPLALGEDLLRIGLTLREDLNGEAIVRRYDAAGTNGLRSSRASHIAWARAGAVHHALRAASAAL